MNGDAVKVESDSRAPREARDASPLKAATDVIDGMRERFIGVKTASTYRAWAREKIGLMSNTDLNYDAVKHGLVQ